ncbi:MAG: nuclear transport factor 2 family protein, partial [Flavisolibacter sp.]|nr:nuclear transport factor 2 family protein [Flavisolibacter sp.]
YYTNNGMAVEGTMTYDQLIALTKKWSKNKTFNESTPRKIIVLDMLDKTASAKLKAYWGIDYFHLAKLDGKWMIINVLWQDYPKK